MLDLALLFILTLANGGLLYLLYRLSAAGSGPTPVWLLSSIAWWLLVAVVLLALQLGVVLFRGNDATVTSFGYVLPIFLNMAYSFVVLVTVVVVVGVGIYLSLQQFDLWKRGQERLLELTRDASSATDQGQNVESVRARTQMLNTQIQLSAKGVTIATPVIGLAVLTISLGFLYLFLRYAVVAAPH